MRDIERELRELGTRVREGQAPPGLRPTTLRAVRRRRTAAVATALFTVILLGLSGTYALGTFRTYRSELAPADGSRPTSGRVFSVFSNDERVVVEVDGERGTICAVLTSLEKQKSLTRVEIVRGLDEPQTLVTLRPNEDAFVPSGGGAECVAGVDAATAQAVINHPEDHFVLVDGRDSRVRISALTRRNGDGNYATGRHVTIAKGRFLGVEWEYYGYESNDGLCLEFAWGSNSGGGCGFRRARRDYVFSIGGTSVLREAGVATVAEFEGQVSDAVERLTVEVNGEESRVLRLVEPPRALGLEDRQFVHLIDARKLDRGSRVWLVAYDANNRVLDRQEVRGLQAPEGQHSVSPGDEMIPTPPPSR